MTTDMTCTCENYDGERLCPFCEGRVKPTYANVIVRRDGTAIIDVMTASDKWAHLKGQTFADVFVARRIIESEGLSHAVIVYA